VVIAAREGAGWTFVAPPQIEVATLVVKAICMDFPYGGAMPAPGGSGLVNQTNHLLG
jgi:hypothetical protein